MIIPNPHWRPVTRAERYPVVDVLRGIALFGVLIVNLMSAYRISLPEHILTFHTDPGRVNRTVDALVAGLVEFKAFTLFSFLFGVGMAIQAERAVERGVSPTRHLVRRFLILLAIGLCHMLLIFNGDILTLYGVCALLLVPVLGLRTLALALLAAVALILPEVVLLGIPFPSEQVLRADAAEAIRVYSGGSFTEILKFRWEETASVIVPLLLSVLPRTIGLMLCGVAGWRFGVLRQPEKHKELLRAIFLGGGRWAQRRPRSTSSPSRPDNGLELPSGSSTSIRTFRWHSPMAQGCYFGSFPHAWGGSPRHSQLPGRWP